MAAYKRVRTKRRYAEDPEFRKRVNATTRRWEKRNPEKVKARCVANHENILAAHRRWREGHKEQVKAYRLSVKERHRTTNAKWYREHAEHVKAKVAQWVRENREKNHSYAARREARERGATGSHTLAEWKELCRRTGDCCVYCDEPKRLERDHAIPLSRGGSDNISNILPACRSCNAKKHTRTAEEFVFHR